MKRVIVGGLLACALIGAGCTITTSQVLRAALASVRIFAQTDGALVGITPVEATIIADCTSSVDKIVTDGHLNWVTNADIAWSRCSSLGLSPATQATIAPYVDAVQMAIEVLYAAGLV